MCTYNGAAYLREQLESFAAQTFSDWVLYVSDDASTDDTLRILSDYQVLWGNQRLVIFNGPCKGFAENFISLVQRPEIEADYFAFSDQDDVWFSDKLERSVNRLEHLDSSKPALYCSRTRLVDADLKVIGVSPLFSKPPSFKNALVQSLAGANTMLINQTARGLLVRLPEHSPLIAHDWLTYLLVTGCGGEVCYDAEPCLDYRQHSGNLIGANASTRDRLVRFRKMLSGRFIEWNDANVAILNEMECVLTEESRSVLAYFETGRREVFLKRVLTLRKAGIYRQTVQGNLSLMLAVCLGRV
ncbi:Glycosyl transferase [Pseudomonas syringae pv. cilantro]|nr:Glycosyl transferase [Pseudomonas syringae pv. cilantro]